MGLRHESNAILGSVEPIELTPLDINPGISACKIKVFYLGEDRHKMYTDKETALRLAKTLRGAPIVGEYKEEKKDFRGHGEEIVISEGEVSFKKKTVPYGFVSPDAEIWFQKYQEKDENGNAIVREYLVTNGFLWTDAFPECKSVIQEGKGQSMELRHPRGKTVNKLYILNDAVISRLCILGDDVDPCFEGSSITSSVNFSNEEGWTKTFATRFLSMSKELKQIMGGSTGMLKDTEETKKKEEEKTINKTSEEEKTINKTSEEPSEKLEGEKASKKTKNEDEKPNSKEAPKKEENKSLEQIETKLKTLQEKYEKLEKNFSLISNEKEELLSFKKSIIDERKDDLIKKQFYMLSDEDKSEVVKNKDNLSLEEIKAQLSMICFDKRINFTLNEKQEEKEEVNPSSLTFSLNAGKKEENANIPEWAKQVINKQKNM